MISSLSNPIHRYDDINQEKKFLLRLTRDLTIAQPGTGSNDYVSIWAGYKVISTWHKEEPRRDTSHRVGEVFAINASNKGLLPRTKNYNH